MVIPIFFTFILSYILFSISKEDIETMLISEKKLRVFAASGIFYMIYFGSSNEKINIIDLILYNSFSMLIIFIMMFMISYISYNIFGVNSLGIGDIKLSSFSSIWLGIELCFLSLCISFLLSAIYSLYGKFAKRLILLQQYPFAPFLSILMFLFFDYR